MACDTFTWTEVAPENWECMKGEAQKMGLTLTGNNGTLQLSTPLGAVAGNYDYNPDNKVLAVTITDKPMFVPCSMIEDRLNEMVKKCR